MSPSGDVTVNVPALGDSNAFSALLDGPGRDGASIELITVEGLGHVWPGGNAPAPALFVGPTSDRPNATDTVWEFFRTHPGPPDKS